MKKIIMALVVLFAIAINIEFNSENENNVSLKNLVKTAFAGSEGGYGTLTCAQDSWGVGISHSRECDDCAWHYAYMHYNFSKC